MNAHASDEDQTDPRTSFLVNSAQIPMADLIRPGDSVLDNALRRVLDDAVACGEAISGWTSYVD